MKTSDGKKMRTVCLCAPDPFWRKLDVEAKKNSLSRSALIRTVLIKTLNLET